MGTLFHRLDLSAQAVGSISNIIRSVIVAIHAGSIAFVGLQCIIRLSLAAGARGGLIGRKLAGCGIFLSCRFALVISVLGVIRKITTDLTFGACSRFSLNNISERLLTLEKEF